MHRQILLIVVVLSFTYQRSFAQDITDLSLPEVNSGNVLSLSALSQEKAVVFIFMSNSCPFATVYLERITELFESYPDITFALINSYSTPQESMINMKTTWLGWNTPLPYLADKDQLAKEQFNIRKSPTVVILKPVNNGFSIYYKGKIDNNPQVAADVKEAYLKDNLSSLLDNKPPKHPNNQTVGCSIR